MKNNSRRKAFITGEKVYFRALEKEDVHGAWQYWFNDEVVTRYMYKGDKALSIPDIEQFLNGLDDDKDRIFAIVATDNDKHIGNCGLHLIDNINRRAKLGIVIGEKEYLGKGYGKDAVNMLLKYAFKVLGLNRIYLGVNAENSSAIKCYEKGGFKKEGLLKGDMFKNGIYCDVIVMGILKDEFHGKNN